MPDSSEPTRINRVYTRKGDDGQTGLCDGSRVSKASLRVAAYGDVDELNSCLGLARFHSRQNGLRLGAILTSLQNLLFTAGADLATPVGTEVPRIERRHVEQLEVLCDSLLEGLEPLEEFILPGGGQTACVLHLARTICRRAERQVVRLSAEEPINAEVIRFLNRLSDLLFIAARIANQRDGLEDIYAEFSRRRDERAQGAATSTGAASQDLSEAAPPE